MLAREIDIVAIDFETTGQVKGQLNMPWQIGASCIHAGTLVPACQLSVFLRVPIEYHFNPYTPGRWAEKREYLASCNSLLEEWPRLCPWLTGHWLAAHNVPTERKILRQTFPMHQFGPWIDTLRMVRAAYPALASHSLGDVLDALDLTGRVEAACPDLAPHDAMFDAVGCACLFEHIISLPEWKNMEATDLTQL